MKVLKRLTKRSLRIRRKWKRKKALYKLKRREINKMSAQGLPVPVNNRTAGCYWANYYNALKWADHYKNRRLNLNDSFSRSDLPSNKTNVMGPYKHFHSVNANFKQTVEDESVCNDVISYEDDNYDDSSSESEDVVVTEELMMFLEENMKIKACLEKEKLKYKKEEDGEEVLERDQIDDCKVPTADGELLKRTKEMEDLYGKSAAMIHGMETAVQLTFNRNCDKFRPPNWPILPFKFLFKQPLKLY